MNYTKILLFSILLSSITIGSVKAQVSGCDDINVETKLTEPSKGRNNGKIEFEFKEKSKTYRIFLINRDAKDAKSPLKGLDVRDLKAGFYDFIIVDDRGCTKQLTVTLKGN
jgi:hypothetical protein